MQNKRRKSNARKSQKKDIQLLQILNPINQIRQKPEKHQETHSDTGELLKAILYGGLDGSTTIIIVVLSGISSGTSASMILGISIPTLVGHAVGMGLGDYLSAKAEIQYIENQKQGILYKIDNMLQEQKQQIISLYTTQDPNTGLTQYSLEDASRVVDLFSTNKTVFGKILLLYERGLVQSDISLAKRSGIATFLSFFFFGLIPAIPYMIFVGMMHQTEQPWMSVTIIGIIQLYSLGMGKGMLLSLDAKKAGIQTLLLGAFLSLVGYILGFAFPA